MLKIKELNKLAVICQMLKSQGKVIVHCHGVWDLVHPGHIRHLRAAKCEGDVLVVTVTPDRYVNRGPGRPVFNQVLRAETIAALECVDYVAINEWPTAAEAIKMLRPDVYAKGSDYAKPENDITGKIIEENQAVEEVGGRIHFTYEIAFSSTQLINRYLNPYPEEAQDFLKTFRQKYSAEEIIDRLKSLKNLKVMVVGDTIIDEYCYCAPAGSSLRRGVLTYRYIGGEMFAGGSVYTAINVAQFCGEVTLLTAIGYYLEGGNYEDFIRSQLPPNVIPVFFYTGAPTVVKRRFIDDSGHTVYYLSFIDESKMDHHEKLRKYLEVEIPRYDMVIVNDFGHGLLTKEVIPCFHSARFLCLNVQTNSLNMGFNLITKYPNADYLCQDELEVKLVGQADDLEEIICSLASQMGNLKIAVTLGGKGSITYDGNFYRIPALTKSPKDTMGAGDAYFAVTSPCAVSHFPMDLVGFIGNSVSALASQIKGNSEPVRQVALFKFITALLK